MKIIVEIAANKKYCGACGCLEVGKGGAWCHAFVQPLFIVSSDEKTVFERCKKCKTSEQEFHKLELDFKVLTQAALEISEGKTEEEK